MGAPVWLTITSGGSGSGNGVVSFSAAGSYSAVGQGTELNVGGSQGFSITVSVAAAYASSNVGVMPHLAAEGGWRTSFTLVNKS